MPDVISESEGRPINVEGGEALYKETMEKFMALMDKDVEKAVGQFGVTLLHSLPLDRRIAVGDELGLNPDHISFDYDRGVLAAYKEDWDGAIKHFEQALKKDETMLDALFNLALATHKKGDKAGAKKLFEKYLAAAEKDERRLGDIAPVKAMLQGADETQ